MQQENCLDISKIAQGSLQEKIQREWQRVLDNLQDPNIPFKPARKLIIELNCVQDETRTHLSVNGTVKTKLAPEQPVVANFGQQKDLVTGKAYAKEYTPIDARQINFDEYKEVDGYLVDKDGVIQNKEDSIINLNRKVK